MIYCGGYFDQSIFWLVILIVAFEVGKFGKI